MKRGPRIVRAPLVLKSAPKAPTTFRYALAGLRAPREVRKAVEHFRKLPEHVKARVPLLWWLLGSSTSKYKMAPADANYGAPPEGVAGRCSNCNSAYAHLGTNTAICSQISGTIEATAWCRLWNPVVPKAVFEEDQRGG